MCFLRNLRSWHMDKKNFIFPHKTTFELSRKGKSFYTTSSNAIYSYLSHVSRHFNPKLLHLAEMIVNVTEIGTFLVSGKFPPYLPAIYHFCRLCCWLCALGPIEARILSICCFPIKMIWTPSYTTYDF